MPDQRLMGVALGKQKADLAVINGNLVNVNTGETYRGGVAVCGDRIAAIGNIDYTIGEQTQVIDATGHYIVPGFIDAYIHPESSNLSIGRFAEIVLAHGTTSIMTDLHEIGVVGGMEAVAAVLEGGKRTPLKIHFVVPSHVPFSPGLETSGGHFDAGVVAQAIQRDDAVGLSEIVAPYVLMNYPDLMQSIALTKKARKILAGHAPVTSGPALSAYLTVGVSNDHEAMQTEEALERLRNGVYLFMRESPVAQNMAALIKAVTEHKVDSRLCSIVTDDTDPMELTEQGHMDHKVRRAMQEGANFVTAIQMVTLNPATAFHLEMEIGSLAPGRYADINIVSGPQDFRVVKTIASGRLVAQDGRMVAPIGVLEHSALLLNTFHLKAPVKPGELAIATGVQIDQARVRVMRTLDWIPITVPGEANLPVKDGYIRADPEQDVLHIAVVERHHQIGNIGRAFMGGFNLKAGAIGSSVAHDNHNIVVMGINLEDMALAVNRLAELQGGQIVVRDSKILEEVPLPILGLLSDDDAYTLADKKRRMVAKAKECGATIRDPFMFLSFITLAAIPEFAITDKGYIAVEKQEIIDPVISVH
ncbi:MAG: amidohydrolase family protein [Chloroflexi bacterium]|nr:amidohydrolase family protein [Chloroflexota bacterium]MCL5074407.1 amidohydrolase family protein [Chloroflexota bacterium]